MFFRLKPTISTNIIYINIQNWLLIIITIITINNIIKPIATTKLIQRQISLICLKIDIQFNSDDDNDNNNNDHSEMLCDEMIMNQSNNKKNNIKQHSKVIIITKKNGNAKTNMERKGKKRKK